MKGSKVARLDERRMGSPDWIAKQLEELAAEVRAGKVTAVAIAATLKTGGLRSQWHVSPAGRLFDVVAAVQYLATKLNVTSFLGQDDTD